MTDSVDPGDNKYARYLGDGKPEGVARAAELGSSSGRLKRLTGAQAQPSTDELTENSAASIAAHRVSPETKDG